MKLQFNPFNTLFGFEIAKVTPFLFVVRQRGGNDVWQISCYAHANEFAKEVGPLSRGDLRAELLNLTNY